MKTAAATTDADIIVFIDGDGQHNPDDIPDILVPILQGQADFVIGSRYLKGSILSANPFFRKAFQRAGYEDPTNVLFAEAKAGKGGRRSLLDRLLQLFAPGWGQRIGTGARMRGVDLQQAAKDRALSRH